MHTYIVSNHVRALRACVPDVAEKESFARPCFVFVASSFVRLTSRTDSFRETRVA